MGQSGGLVYKFCSACMQAPETREEMFEVFWQSYFKMIPAFS